MLWAGDQGLHKWACGGKFIVKPLNTQKHPKHVLCLSSYARLNVTIYDKIHTFEWKVLHVGVVLQGTFWPWAFWINPIWESPARKGRMGWWLPCAFCQLVIPIIWWEGRTDFRATEVWTQDLSSPAYHSLWSSWPCYSTSFWKWKWCLSYRVIAMVIIFLKVPSLYRQYNKITINGDFYCHHLSEGEGGDHRAHQLAM